jgi:hypothetical protein
MKRNGKSLTTLLLMAALYFPACRNNLQAQEIHWQNFDWFNVQDKFLENTPERVITANLHLSGTIDPVKLEISLNNPHSVLNSKTFDEIIYFNPGIKDRIRTEQRTGHYQQRILNKSVISLDNRIIGEDEFLIIQNPNESSTIKGNLGFGLFHRDRKILLIDNVNSRFAITEDLPEYIEATASFVPMKVVTGYIVIPVEIEGRQVEVFFDGTSRPALVLFHKATYRSLASPMVAAEKLRHRNNKNQSVSLMGYKSRSIVKFDRRPLKKYDVYYSAEKIPARVKGKISRAFFDDYILILDYKNERFGMALPPSAR